MLLFFLFPIGIAQAENQQKENIQELPGIQIIIKNVKKAVQTKDFTPLKSYVLRKGRLYWGICGPSDGEPIRFSFDAMIHKLIADSKGAQIYVHKEPDIDLWDPKNTVFMVDIKTEGWTGEYPYLSFGFKYTKKTNQWEWRGVCYSRTPPPKISGGEYEPLYEQKPILPRPGPRIFEQYSTLRARIEEIIKFMALDALKPYAIKQSLIFGECSKEMMDSDEIKGDKVSVNQVIDFLKKNANTGVKPTRVYYSKFLETEGWSGEYPFVSFWFTETKKGWEWAGVSYCKTSLIKVQFPEEPRFK